MGFLDRLLGRKEKKQRRRQRRKGPPRREDLIPEKLIQEIPKDMEFKDLPFTAMFRLKALDYDRLKGDWVQYTIGSGTDWYHKLDTLYDDFKTKFGVLTTKRGKTVERWNDRTWRALRPHLVIEITDPTNRRYLDGPDG